MSNKRHHRLDTASATSRKKNKLSQRRLESLFPYSNVDSKLENLEQDDIDIFDMRTANKRNELQF